MQNVRTSFDFPTYQMQIKGPIDLDPDWGHKEQCSAVARRHELHKTDEASLVISQGTAFLVLPTLDNTHRDFGPLTIEFPISLDPDVSFLDDDEEGIERPNEHLVINRIGDINFLLEYLDSIIGFLLAPNIKVNNIFIELEDKHTKLGFVNENSEIAGRQTTIYYGNKSFWNDKISNEFGEETNQRIEENNHPSRSLFYARELMNTKLRES